MPMYFPHRRALPEFPGMFYQAGRKLYLVRTDSTDRLMAVNTSEIGDVAWIMASPALVWSLGFSGAYAAGVTFLRKFILHSLFSYDTLRLTSS